METIILRDERGQMVAKFDGRTAQRIIFNYGYSNFPVVSKEDFVLELGDSKVYFWKGCTLSFENQRRRG